ncbi:hypothetical protein [Ideonella sp. YS5]|uniref:hypothetical protein n=1 Tax=Ideonella sp. YS5 TaxID=3453714 RepID=UPI003EEB9EA5
MRSIAKFIPLTLLLLLGATAGQATEFQLAPVQLPGGVSVFGTVSTDGTTGPLSPANLTGWRVTVRTTTRHDYTPANAPPQNVLGVSVSADGRKLRVATSPDGNGGALSFGTSLPEVLVHVANYATGWPPGMGFAMFQYGADFEYADLPVSPTGQRVVARAAAGSSVFKLLPVDFPSGARLTGSITTDGSTGVLQPDRLLDWHLSAKRIEDVVYYRDAGGSNSQVLPSSAGLSTDGQTLHVARPGGYLGFGVPPAPPARGRGAVPADFSDTAPSRGQAGWFDPFGFDFVPLRFGGTQYPVGQALP